jgi:hypothetical protein
VYCERGIKTPLFKIRKERSLVDDSEIYNGSNIDNLEVSEVIVYSLK